MNQDDRDFEIFKLLAYTVLAVIGGAAALVAFIWLVSVAAGTGWSVSVVALGIAMVWGVDMLWPRRRSSVTALQRFEEREQRRHAA